MLSKPTTGTGRVANSSEPGNNSNVSINTTEALQNGSTVPTQQDPLPPAPLPPATAEGTDEELEDLEAFARARELEQKKTARAKSAELEQKKAARAKAAAERAKVVELEQKQQQEQAAAVAAQVCRQSPPGDI